MATIKEKEQKPKPVEADSAELGQALMMIDRMKEFRDAIDSGENADEYIVKKMCSLEMKLDAIIDALKVKDVDSVVEKFAKKKAIDRREKLYDEAVAAGRMPKKDPK